jgi:O-antigen/teichoic acid export membrane protein
MIGQILTRLASVLLLPLYTKMLLPADYGVMAILDLTAALLSTFLAGGMVSAVTRHHFDNDNGRHHDKVWWTGMSMVGCVCTVVCLMMFLGRHILADVTLGAEISQGAWFYTLTIATLWLTVIGIILDSYLRVIKWSGVFVVISMGRLLFNIGLNVWLLVGLKMGVEGLLLGNLAATFLHTAALALVFLRTRGAFSIDRKIGREMLTFAAPLVFAAIAGMAMHEADRYFLRIWDGLPAVGVYSLAHRIGFAVHALCLLPFLSIWHVAIYDIERMPDSNKLFTKMFGWFTSGLGILLLGASLTVHPVLPFLTPDTYGNAIEMISVILLGFFVFALSFMFEVPSLLTKRTRLMVPGSIVGLVVNIAANFVLIPQMGPWGAAWAGVLTYAAYSGTLLYCCRKAMVIEYPWLRFCVTLVALCSTYVGLRYGVFPSVGPLAQIGSSVVVCAAFAVVLFGREGLDLALEALAKLKLKRAGNTSVAEPAAENTAPDEELVSAS